MSFVDDAVKQRVNSVRDMMKEGCHTLRGRFRSDLSTTFSSHSCTVTLLTHWDFRLFHALHYLSYIDDLGIVGIRKNNKRIKHCFQSLKFQQRMEKRRKSYEMSVINLYLLIFLNFLSKTNVLEYSKTRIGPPTFSEFYDNHITFFT